MGTPSVSGRGGQDRARGAPFDSSENVVRFRPIQPAGGGGGGGRGVLADSRCPPFQPIYNHLHKYLPRSEVT